MVDDDEESLAVVRKALRPIDDYREGQARRAKASSGAAVDAAPTAPVTPATPSPK